MQFFNVLALSFVSGALASPLVTRDAAPVLSAFADITTSLGKIDAGILAVTDATKAKTATPDLVAKSQALITVLKNSATKVAASSPLTVVDAASIVPAAQKLTDLVSKVIGEFLAKKDLIQQAGAIVTVNGELKQQTAAAQLFINAVVSKTPPSLASVAAELSGYVTASLNKGIAGFSH